jgi:cytoskeletal protein CcmA (bactofilin family)
MSRWRRSRDPRGPEEGESAPSRPAAPEQVPLELGPDVREVAPVTTKGEGGPPVVQEVRMNPARDRSEMSVVSRGTRIEGTVVATGSLRVDGQVKGKITAEKEVSLSAEGCVDANIQATSITLAGQVKGDLTAKGDISLPADSRLDGDIHALNVDVGGMVNGDIVAKGRVKLGSRARVEGNIASPTLAIAEGAVFIGSSDMGEGPRQGDQTRKAEKTTEPAERMVTGVG